MRVCVGIDPGKTGAVAYVSDGGAPNVDSLPVVGSTKGRTRYDPHAFASLLIRLSKNLAISIVTVEQLHALPRTMGGGIANYARGEAMGVIWTLAALQIPFQLVSPQRWQAAMLAGAEGKDTKQRALVAAKRLFPMVDWSQISARWRSGAADALLLAEYGRRNQR
jgi:hypothetical protein